MTNKAFIHEGDYKVGDRVRIIFKDKHFGEIGTVVSVVFTTITIKLEDGKIEKYAYRSSVELVKYSKEKVVFT